MICLLVAIACLFKIFRILNQYLEKYVCSILQDCLNVGTFKALCHRDELTFEFLT